jgi:exopolysaccharide biosynthesis polyprenyl glycosylphosphotransferase
LHVLDLAKGPVEELNYVLLKRVFDIVFSLLVICVSAPLMAVIATAIRLSMQGPLLFAQERVGLNGKVFRMYKFRTMKIASSTEADTRWTVQNDPRCTRLGTLLRRTSLDELPQFFNVLKGDMSVVGPRPERPFFVQKFLNEVSKYNTRHQLKVGITGWAQVNGLRGDTSISERVRYDLYYLQNWSLRLDLRIIFLTFWSGLFGKNAY